MTAPMFLPHLILVRTKKGTDSFNKTVIRRLQLFNQGKLDELLTEAKALPLRRSDGAKRQSQPLKSFTEFMKDGKISNANRTFAFASDAEGKVLSLMEKIGD